MLNFDGPVWRIVPSAAAEFPDRPGSAAEGRFHRPGQFAIYASLSAEGARIAIRRYLSDGISRSLLPLWLEVAPVIDRRGDLEASLVWQDNRALGKPASTWQISDVAREAGGLAMLYSSRSRPDLAHVVIFALGHLKLVGPATPFEAQSASQLRYDDPVRR